VYSRRSSYSDGNWIGDYIPDVIRAYPFQLIKPQDREDKVLCLDTDSGLIGDAGQGEPFFDGDGPSPAIKEVLNQLSETETSRVLTQRLVDALQSSGLIQPWSMKLEQGGKTVPVEGLYRIDEAALNLLSDEEFIALRKSGALPLVYAQLFSMNQLAVLPRAAEVQERVRKQKLTQNVTYNPNLTGMKLNMSDGELIF
ncbi:MAG: SapC family protein, partial [Deltaproteobacteria bacterium]